MNIKKIALLSVLLSYVSSWCLEEKPLVVVIPSYNNEQWVETNLRSVYSQNYSNYRVLYYDDCSTDKTAAKARAIAAELGQEHRTIIISNPERRGAMANWYYAVHSCQDNEIIINLDGDDWLKHDGVLAKINEVYADPNTWMTYGQFQFFPANSIGLCRSFPDWVIKQQAYRQYEWLSSHLRTYYAGLFKRIVKEDLCDENYFFKTACDLAMMFPMLEMAGHHVRFIRDVLYVYNWVNPIGDSIINVQEQANAGDKIRLRKKYQLLSEHEFAQPSETYKR